MEVQPTIKQFFKSRKRPVSILKKDQELNERPSKVFVTEKKLGIVDEKSLLSKVVYTSSTQSADDEVSEINNAAVTEKSASTSASTSNEKPTLAADPARPSTPENFISVEPPKTPNTIRNAEPTTPSHKNVLPDRPSTPESNVEALEAIQKVNINASLLQSCAHELMK
jgi:hypothetical protein